MSHDDKYDQVHDLILQAVARGYCSAENSHKELDAELCKAIAGEVYRAVDEHFALKLAAISVACGQNTPESAKKRIGRDKQWRLRRAAEGRTRAVKRRVAAGVCPCCTRTFQNLAAHMQNKHPGFPTEEA